MYIHIGGPKTGTSAIQSFLASNRNILKKKNYCYPGKTFAHYDISTTFHNKGELKKSDANVNGH